MLIFEVYNEEPPLSRADTPEGGEATDITRESRSLPDSWYAKDKVQLLVCQYRHHVGDGLYPRYQELRSAFSAAALLPRRRSR